MKKNALIICLTLAVLALSATASRSSGVGYDGRFRIALNDANGLNYLIDTQTGDTWVMQRMQREGHPVGVWIPNVRADSIEEAEKAMNGFTRPQLEPARDK